MAEKNQAKRSTASKTKVIQRVSGRPMEKNAVGRQAILDSTVLLLKTRAPEQLTVLEVAKIAGVTRTLVRYYFGSLNGLLQEVTEYLMGELQDRMQVRMHGSVCERVHQRLVARLEFMREHPYFERLALTEIYYGDDTEESNPEGTSLQRITKRGLELTNMVLEDAPDSQVDPRFLHLAMLSISAFIPNAQPLLVHLFGAGKKGEQQVDEYLQFISRMLADAIERPQAAAAVPIPAPRVVRKR